MTALLYLPLLAIPFWGPQIADAILNARIRLYGWLFVRRMCRSGDRPKLYLLRKVKPYLDRQHKA